MAAGTASALGILLSLAVLGTPGVFAAAPNDSFASATPIVTLPFVDEGIDVSLATVDPDEPRPSCAPLRNTAWYALEPEADTPLAVRVIPSDGDAFDIGLAAWAMGPDGTLTEIGCEDAQGPGVPERLTFAVTGDTPHYVQVGAVGRPDTYPGTFDLVAALQSPEHDLFAFARPVETQPYVDAEVDAVAATRESAEPVASCADMEATTWYRIKPGDDTVLRARVTPADLGGNALDPAIAVYSGTSLEGLTEVGCVDASGVQEAESIDIPLSGGADYAIAVGAVPGIDAWPGAYTFAVAGPQTIGLASVPAMTYRDAAVALSAEATSGLAVDFSTEGPCYAQDGLLVATGAGTCTLTASQAGDAEWAPAPVVTLDVPVGKASQAITIEPVGETVVGAPFEVVAEVDSGLTVVVEAAGSCVADGRYVLPVSTGTCTLTMSQAGDADWAAADPLSVSVDVARAPQLIEIDPVGPLTYGDPPLGLGAVATSGLALDVQLSGPCSLDGDSIDPTGAGTCLVTVSQPGDDSWAPAEPVSYEVEIARAAQSIDLEPIGDLGDGSEPVTLAAAASSGLPVSFSTLGTCHLSGGQLVVDGPGDCLVTASQPGDADWLDAEPVRQALRIRATQSIDFPPIGEAAFGDDPLELSATSSSGLPVSYRTEGPCEQVGASLVVRGAGTCTITATQPGDADTLAAEPVTALVEIGKMTQTIDFQTVADATFGDGPLSIDAQASSGLPVSLAVDGPCRVDGTRVAIEGAGLCRLIASQPGDQDHEAAAEVERVLRIARAPQTILLEAPDVGFLGTPPTALDAMTSSGLRPALVASGSCEMEGDKLAYVDVGQCTLSASHGGTDDLLPAPDVSSSFEVIGPIVGEQKNFVGKVATQPPGTYVAPGATITSALVSGVHRPQYYAVALEEGDTLVVEVRGLAETQFRSIDYDRSSDRDDDRVIEWIMLSPSELAAGQASWQNFGSYDADLDAYVERRIATETGVHTIGIADFNREASGRYRYSIRFRVQKGSDLADQPSAASVRRLLRGTYAGVISDQHEGWGPYQVTLRLRRCEAAILCGTLFIPAQSGNSTDCRSTWTYIEEYGEHHYFNELPCNGNWGYGTPELFVVDDGKIEVAYVFGQYLARLTRTSGR